MDVEKTAQVDKQEITYGTDKENSIGEINISPEVVSAIACNIVGEVEGVAGMNAGIAEGLVQAFNRKTPTKGVKIELDNGVVILDLHVIIKYGYRIPDVSWSIQESVKKGVEQTTGLKVREINIHIQGIDFGKDVKEKEDK